MLRDFTPSAILGVSVRANLAECEGGCAAPGRRLAAQPGEWLLTYVVVGASSGSGVSSRTLVGLVLGVNADEVLNGLVH